MAVKMNGTFFSYKAGSSAGSQIVTSTTRPGVPVSGEVIYETDTGITRVWDDGLGGWRMVTPYRQRLDLTGTSKTMTIPATVSAVRVEGRWTGRSSAALSYDSITFRTNGVSAANYTYTKRVHFYNAGDQFTHNVDIAQTGMWVGNCPASTTANIFGNGEFTAMSVAGGTSYINQHQYRSRGGYAGTSTSYYWLDTGGYCAGATGLITSATLVMGTGSFVSGSYCELEAWEY